MSTERNELREKVGLVLMRAAAFPKVEIDMPVNMCPDDDPPGERPVEKVWATDIGAMADALLPLFAEVAGQRDEARALCEQYRDGYYLHLMDYERPPLPWEVKTQPTPIVNLAVSTGSGNGHAYGPGEVKTR